MSLIVARVKFEPESSSSHESSSSRGNFFLFDFFGSFVFNCCVKIIIPEAQKQQDYDSSVTA